MTSAPSDANTSSKPPAYFESRSRMRKRNGTESQRADEVARLLGHPQPVGIRGDAGEAHLAGQSVQAKVLNIRNDLKG